MSHVRIDEGIISGTSYPANVVRLRGQAASACTTQGGDHGKLSARGNRSREIRKRGYLHRQGESGRQSDPGESRLPATSDERAAEILSIPGPHRNAFQKHGVPHAGRDQRD